MSSADFRRFLSDSRPWLADAGLETDAIFNHGFDLPAFASFTLLEDAKGRDYAAAYFARFHRLAAEAGTGFVLDTMTWRANAPWLARMGRDGTVEAVNRAAVEFARSLREAWSGVPVVLAGMVGPAGDGYRIDDAFTPDTAHAAHRPQIAALSKAGVDMLNVLTMTHLAEAQGIIRAAAEAGLPVALSFTVETDGRLPSGQPLDEAVEEADATAPVRPLYYMVNCAHPDHFADALHKGDWLRRLGGIRANASRLSHAELDVATALDDGDPAEFGQLYAGLKARLPAIKVIGGCCGTDHRHVAEAGAACLHGAAHQGA